MELKEKLKKSALRETNEKENIELKSLDVKDVIEALKTLGYTPKKARLAIDKVQNQFKEKLTVEELIRESLKII